MTVSKTEVEPLDTPYDGDDDFDYETYDDDPVVQLIRQNFHDYLGIKHNMTVPELHQLAWDHLDVFYKNSMLPEENSDDFVFDEEKYTHYLEMCFIRLFQDVAVLSKMLMPSNLAHNEEFGSFHPSYNNAYISKLGFNIINNPEINEYAYPKHKGPNSTYSSDSAFRAANESEFEIVLDALNRLPEYWQKSLSSYLKRSAEFLYGSVAALNLPGSEAPSKEQSHSATAPTMLGTH